MDEDITDVLLDCWVNGDSYELMTLSIDRTLGRKLSVRQVKYRMKQLGVIRYNQCTANVLQSTMEMELQLSGSMLGYRGMWRRLRQKYHLNVSRDRVQNMMRNLDPEGVQRRRQRRFKRGVYRSEGPNQTWHIDGNDKLAPWGIGIHGCIDGFSRKLIWLQASPTNRDPKVIGHYYLSAVKECRGCPLTVRCDRGVENTTVAALHTFLRNDVEALKYGRSTANQRIEQYWSTLMRSWTQWWRTFLGELQYEADSLDKSLVQFCFLGIIKEELEDVKLEWNTHRIRNQRHSEVPCGVPNVLFDMPYLHGYSNALQGFDPTDLQTAETQCREPPTVGDIEVQAYLEYVLAHEALFKPCSPHLAKDLYNTLRPFLRS